MTGNKHKIRLMNIKRIALCVAAAGTMTAAFAITPEEYCVPSMAAPAEVKEMTPMPDGETYAAVSDDGKSIELFSFKTGKKTGELYNPANVKGDVKMDYFDGFVISDDGRRVMLWNDKEKIYRTSFTAEYYVYDVARQTMKRVSEKGAQRGATLSHDGRKVAYMRNNNLYISNLDYDTDNPITADGKVNSIINGLPDWGYEEEFLVVNTIRWNGDDTVVAYVKFDESEVPTYSFDAYRNFCMAEPTEDLYPAQYRYKYSLAGYPCAKVSVHAFNLDTRATKKMDIPMADNEYIPSMEFDGAGKNLMITVLNHDQNYLRLFKVNPASTVAHVLLEERSEGGWISPEAFALNGYYEDFFVYGSQKSGYCHLYKYNYDGVAQGSVTSGDFNVTKNYGFDKKKGVHYLQTTGLGAVNRTVVAVNGKGAVTMLTGKPGWEDARWSQGFSYWMREWSDASVPPVYSLMSADGKILTTVEDNAAYKEKYASAPARELLKVKNDLGEDMDAYMIKPHDFDASKKYPVLMYQYNGPDSQEVQNKWRVDGLNYLAEQGYIIGCVDGRGTGFRTRQWAFAVYKQLGVIETTDQIAGARYFASLPYTDATRVGTFGWSYGGYMALMELTREGNPFKCGVSMAPVTDWRYYDNNYTERFMLTPQQNESGYAKSAPMTYTENLKVPLLIMSGTSDDNVHFYNTLKYTSKLMSEGKLFDMMVFTGFDHSLRVCNVRVQLYRKVAEFLERNL